jgi:hypothetical protein
VCVCVCLLLQDLVQSCLHGGGGGIWSNNVEFRLLV